MGWFCTRIAPVLNLNALEIIMIIRLFWLLVLGLTFLSGCVVPGSPNKPVEDDSVTILATVYAPEIKTAGLLPSTGDVNDNDSFARFVASSTCQVNGATVTFSLNEQTRELKIEKLPPAAGYRISLRSGRFILQAYKANTGRQITMPYGLSLKSTSEYLLRKRLAELETIDMAQLSDYEVNSTLVNSLSAKLASELKKADSSIEKYEKLTSDSVNDELNGKTFVECLSRNGKAVSFSGKYSGEVFYLALNSSGQAVYAVQAVASMTCTQNGTSAWGSISLEPKAVVPLGPTAGVSAPSKKAFAFNGTVNNSILTFVRKAPNDGSPISGKDLDEWMIYPVRGGLAVRAINLDKAYYTGVQSRAGEFILKKN